MKVGGLIGMLLVTLSACANQKPTLTSCVVAHESGFIGAGGSQEHISVGRNGSACTIGATVRGGSMGEGTISVQPAHGVAAVRVTAEATLVSYTPARDYVGPDEFTVNFGPDFDLNVFVQVVP